ncbi:serine protease [Haloferula chungangensis]|uniref:Serine protease n=1 Tax=Haloferula chungangensis TaxID=1048331 RepID=A0ABW2L8H2_9BACT
MRLLLSFFVATCAVLWSSTVASETLPAGGFSSPQTLSDELKVSLKKVRASCVAVNAGVTASGVIISPEGWVITAAHVIRSAKDGRPFRITLEDGRQAVAEPLGYNRESDFGLLRITSPSIDSWPHCTLAETSAITGDFCFTLAHPSGLQRGRPAQVRMGRIMTHNVARGRPQYLIADCNIQPGDSGGPLFSMKGELIGLDSSAAGFLGFNVFPAIDQFHLDRERLLAGDRWGDQKKSPNGPEFSKMQLTKETIDNVQAEFMRRLQMKYPPTMDFVQTLANEKGEISMNRQAVLGHMGHAVFAIARQQALSLGMDDPSLSMALEPLPNDAVKGLPVHVDGARVGFALALDERHLLTKASLLSADHKTGVRVGDRVLAAKSVARDEAWDLALLQVEEDLSVAPVKWPASPAAVEAGDLLVARDHADRLIWNIATDRARPVTKARSVGPLLDESIISKHRAPYPEVIRHALPLVGRDAGMPVFDSSGNLVGMHIARFTRIVGLIIPVTLLEARAEALLAQAGDE